MSNNNSSGNNSDSSSNNLHVKEDSAIQNSANKNVRVSHINVGGATYEVRSIYAGQISFLELLKQMLKRDIDMFK